MRSFSSRHGRGPLGSPSALAVLALALLVALVGPVSALAAEPPADSPAVIGSWELLPLDAPMTPIHAALLHNGRVWLASGSGNDRVMAAAGEFHSFVWDPATGSFDDIDTPWDVFGSGHAFLPDGRLLIAGGTLAYDSDTGLRDWKGSRRAYTFDPLTENYTRLPDMAAGRWYPTLTTLGDGRVYVTTGIDDVGLGNVVRRPEIFSSTGGGTWKRKDKTPSWPTYPSLLLARDGRLFHSGGNVDPALQMTPGFVNVRTGALSPVPGLSVSDTREQSATVLLPVAQKQRVMIIGGGFQGDATNHVDIVNLDARHPTFHAGPPLNFARMHLNAVLLPDRTVLVVGGGAGLERDPVLAAEVYDPVANDWSVLASESVARLYHSLAVLLPDGRVLVGGSNPSGHFETQLEIYSPPYMFQGPRPSIEDAPTEVGYGDRVQIDSNQAGSIKWVSLIRPSAVTHSTDTEQRVVGVPFRMRMSGALELTITDQPNIAPPGWYMLFVTNDDGIPSVAHWVHLT